MEEIYWITRLNGINIFLNIMTVFGIVLTVVSIGGYIITKNDDFVDDCWKELWIKLFKYCFPTTIIITLLFIFTPTTKEAFAIWGVGGTIDYIKSNEKIKELPDKVVNTLDLWINNYLENDSIK